MNFSYGFGISYAITKSNEYYLNNQNTSFGQISPDGFYQYETKTFKKGNGVLLISEADLNILNKKGKRFCIVTFLINVGLKNIQETEIEYQYGSFINPANTTNLRNVTVKTKGTNFGFMLGVPVKLLKLK